MSIPTLDCQACGTILRHLSPVEAKYVADNPYDYVRWCWECRKEGLHELA